MGFKVHVFLASTFHINAELLFSKDNAVDEVFEHSIAS